MTRLSDHVIARLQGELLVPDLTGTRYEAVRMLGRGGMATVWLVNDAVLKRPVAMKILAPETSSPELAARLLNEARVLAQLEHPGIVPVHDAGALADGRTFYCMKYVQGKTLDEFIRDRGLRERLELLRRMMEPVAFAHAHGFVHRDLKPGNVMIGAFGEVLVMDWGLAKSLEQIARPESQSAWQAGYGEKERTSHGMVLGTSGFMSPEQERGDQQSVDERSDVFSLGAILQFMLDGVKEQPSRALQAIATKATAAEKGSRYPGVPEFSAEIEHYLRGEPVDAYPEAVLEKMVRQVRRHQVAVVLVLVYLVMRLAFIIFSR